MKYIHINCDLGEGGENDAELMTLISACNIACGGHAGTVESMRETVALAIKNRVEIGAHPSYPDKENFGRISLEIHPEDLKRSIVAQIISLKQITESEGGKLVHIKPHGALYNDAATNEKIAEIVLNAIEEFDEDLPIYAPENSIISHLAKGRNKVIYEAFADRNYEDNYQLVSRQKNNALITEKEKVFDHLLEMFLEGKITGVTGRKIDCAANTFCLHSDTPNAIQILNFLEEKLRENNIHIFKI